MKRSTAVTLILLGTGAAGMGVAMSQRNCVNEKGEPVSCGSSSSSRGWSSGWAHWGSSSTSSSTHTTIARGGFGSTGHSASG